MLLRRGSTGIPEAILAYVLHLLIYSVEISFYIPSDLDLSVKDKRTCATLDDEMHVSRMGHCSRERADQAQSLKIARHAILVLAHLHQVQLRRFMSHRYIADRTCV